jgi:hypothetical protein
VAPGAQSQVDREQLRSRLPGPDPAGNRLRRWPLSHLIETRDGHWRQPSNTPIIRGAAGPIRPDHAAVSSLPRGGTLCNAIGHEPALGEFAIMMMLAWRHRLFDTATSFCKGSWSWSPMVGGAVRGAIGSESVGVET